MRKHYFSILLSLFLSVAIFWPLRATASWYPMHDSTHLTRIILMANTMLSGQLPPLWAEFINDGLGYPLFHFYAPLFHTIASILFIITSSPLLSLKITLFTTVFIGIFGVMQFARRFGRSSALLSGFAFALSPYLASNIYVRGAFSELLSLCLIPWVLLATESLKTKKQIIFATIALSLFVLSHNLIPILALPLILIWMIYHNHGLSKHLLVTLVLSFCLSAWFILPVLFERGFTQTDQVARTTSYALHFVEPWQVWNSTWGFGGSAPGIEDGMSFKLGKLQLILGLISLVIAWRKKNNKILILGGFLAISAFLSFPYSKFIWDQSATLQIVQFPWRSLGLVAVFLSLLSGFALTISSSKLLRFIVAVPMSLALVAFNLKYFAPQSIENIEQNIDEISMQDLPDISKTIPEYAPVWLKKDELDLAEHIQLYTASDVLADESADNLQGQMPWGYQFDLVATRSSQITIGTAYYPTWVGQIDGANVDINPSESGLVTMTLPEGRHKVTLYQSHTLLEKISLLISVVTLFILLRVYVKI